MKPSTREAMTNLIREAREKIPFKMSFTGHCEGRCEECPEKLLPFLEDYLYEWESRLERGVVPDLGDVHALARDCKEVYEILKKKGFVTAN